jgi:hypothetical protein
VKTNLPILLLAGGLAVAGPTAAAAQQAPSPAMRADVSGTVGWLAVDANSAEYFGNHDWASSLFAAATAGWYWTDHLKSEVEVGAGTEASTYGSDQIYVNGLPSFRSIESRFLRRTLSVAQHYQFFRNAWFHPYLGAGLELAWERRTDDYGPFIIWDDPRGQPRQLEPGRREGPRTETGVRAFVQAGFKGYITERGFFRSDVRLSFDDRIDSTQLRAGFGVDF